MPPSRGISTLAVGSVAAGGLLIYAGIRGYSVPHAIQAMLSGNPPSAGGQANPIATGIIAPGQSAGVPGATGSAIADDFLRYVGHKYTFGGAPGRDGSHPWDCSSAANWVYGHDMGLSIPGFPHGSYSGATHGPSTVLWLSWAAAGNLQRVKRADIQAGDLVIWETHMGCAISNTEYVSALDPKEGTDTRPIHGGGPVGEVATSWRYKSPGAGSAPPPRTGTHPKA